MRILPYGDRALLVELADAADVVAYVDAVAAADLGEWAEDVVPGARTVLFKARPGVPLARLEELVSRLGAGAPRTSTTESPVVEVRRPPRPEPRNHPAIEIPVTYDGPDLTEVAELAGLSADEVVAAHTGTPWRVAFGGFAPGFAYLVGGDPRLEVPRRESPRTRVPAGSVGLAGEFSGVYPRSSPGGWQLIGSTDAVLWDLDRDPPALLAAGAVVRFTAR